MKWIRIAGLSLLCATSLSSEGWAQERRADFARINRVEPVDTPAAAWPEIVIDVPDGTVPGILFGGAAGLAAALPVLVEATQSCADCMISPLVLVPVWAAGGMLLGGVTGAAATAAYYPRRYRGERSYGQDVLSGATIGLVLGVVGVVAATSVRSDDWQDDADGGATDEAVMIGLAAPLFTLVGAVTGAIVDASGGDVPSLLSPDRARGREP